MTTFVVFSIPTPPVPTSPALITGYVLDSDEEQAAVTACVEAGLIAGPTVYACDLADTVPFSVQTSVDVTVDTDALPLIPPDAP